jgi:hypothetical protein
MPVVFGGRSVDDDYIIKSSPGRKVGYVHNFTIRWVHTGSERTDIINCKTALKAVELGQLELQQHELQNGKEQTLQ